jgi:hypothetical protein
VWPLVRAVSFRAKGMALRGVTSIQSPFRRDERFQCSPNAITFFGKGGLTRLNDASRFQPFKFRNLGSISRCKDATGLPARGVLHLSVRLLGMHLLVARVL